MVITDGISRDVVLPSGHVALVDIRDWERQISLTFPGGIGWAGRIGTLKWHAAVDRHTTYVRASVYVAGCKRNVSLHRAIMGPSAAIIDHINGNGLDNRRCNLRAVSAAQNRHNSRGSGPVRFKGVSWHKQKRRYQATIGIGGRKKHLGLFDTPQDAAREYDKAATAMWGEFAKTNYATRH